MRGLTGCEVKGPQRWRIKKTNHRTGAAKPSRQTGSIQSWQGIGSDFAGNCINRSGGRDSEHSTRIVVR